MGNSYQKRIAVSTFFFVHGVSFATWASRIPDIKQVIGLNDAELGSLLLVMPISSLMGLGMAGWINRNFDNKPPLMVAMLTQAGSLIGIGTSTSATQLAISLFMMALSFRVAGIAMNTQAVILQKSFAKPINGSFHALWSLGGIVGVGVTTGLVALDVSMPVHVIAAFIGLSCLSAIAYQYLPTGDKANEGTNIKLGKPDPSLLLLGLIILMASFCEGGMFDWSGVYFKEVIKIDLYTTGYFTFMICMTLSRWFLDKAMNKVGAQVIYSVSALLIVAGIGLASIFASFVPAMIGFSMVGLGVAALVPTTFLLAGHSKKYSTGMAISIISSYSIVGMLIGPPLIGFLSHAVGMRLAFAFIALMGACIWPLSAIYFRIQKEK